MRPEGNLADWQRCIICYVAASRGSISHKRTCASYTSTTARRATTVSVRDLLKRRPTERRVM